MNERKDSNMNKKENITDSEEIILEILEGHEPLNMQQIVLYAKEKRAWADSTVKTFVRRLVKKGAVREEQREVLYFAPAYTREKRSQMALAEIIDKFFEGSYKKAMLNFVENAYITKEEMEEALRLIERGKGQE
ncbi:MAG: BlaI/MecI/CopY family transcriptional regulator [Bacteroidales bacterium]|nr:BlaI/MecI/CopY family transcriptional regulator [Lachnoclostridium sp.]MCM1384936.1 BlaI/MecI/CopY family transcriptional regulator [Lachnoclostridium sp.]MCM1465824.1 BlaI/MecI/CopY family transcriptional regulator [Bacteroidales bacterium]